MENKAKTFIKNIAYTLTSNGVSFLVNALIVLFIPKLIGVEEYGYFQLYTLLATYSLYFHFGWCDGIYLRNVGKKREELDSASLAAQYRGIWIMSLILFILLGGASVLLGGENKMWVYLMASAAVLLASPKIYASVLCQATNRMNHYSAVLIAERLVYAVILSAMLLMGIRDYRLLITGDVIGKLAAALIGMYHCRDIIFTRTDPKQLKNYAEDAKTNVKVGLFLLMSNISSVMITGVVQLSVETKWSIETFSKVSLTFNMSKLLLVVVNAVGVVLIPVLKNISEKQMAELYGRIRSLVMALLGFMLAFYYPLKVIMSLWLPQYRESMDYMAMLFPMCLFESKTSLLLNTYLKALREEKKLCAANVAAVLVSVVTSAVLVFAAGNLDAAVISIPCLLALRALMLERTVEKRLGLKLMKDSFIEIILAACFIIFSRCMDSWLMMAAYLAVYAVYLFINRRSLKQAAELFLKKLKR